MVNIALCIPGNERKEDSEAYLWSISLVVAFCRQEAFWVMQDTQETIKVFHGMSFNEGDDFGNGLTAMSDPKNEAYENIELRSIDISSGSDRHEFVRLLTEEAVSHVFVMYPHTSGIQKEIDALTAGGYIEQEVPRIGVRNIPITHFVPDTQTV